jgi:hypothetical protein
MDPWWRPLLLVGGATSDTAYVELDKENLTFRFGFFYQQTFPRSEIEAASPREWPLWLGVGWRTTFRGTVGLIGSYQGVVEVRLRSPARTWGLISYDRLAVSLEEPEQFLAELGAGGG